MATERSNVSLITTLQEVNEPYRMWIDRYDNPGFRLALKAWLPQLGAFFGWNIGRRFRSEIFIAGGPMFIDVRAVSDVRRTFTDWQGNGLYSSSRVEIKGTVRSFSGEVGAVARLRPAKFFDIFAEGSYVFREARAPRGPGMKTTRRFDAITGETTTESTWGSFPWRIAEITFSTPTGWFTAKTVTNNIKQAGVPERDFVLEFSGFQFKAGLSVRL